MRVQWFWRWFVDGGMLRWVCERHAMRASALRWERVRRWSPALDSLNAVCIFCLTDEEMAPLEEGVERMIEGDGNGE